MFIVTILSGNLVDINMCATMFYMPIYELGLHEAL